MGAKTGISWTDSTWSPLRVRVRPDAAAIAEQKGYTSLVQIAAKTAGHAGHHCEHVSPECTNCYSESNQSRCLTHNGTGLPFDRRSRDLVEPFVDEKILLDPLRWKTPRKIFVESQSDLFGEWYSDEMIERVFGVMRLADWHTFQVLTKRHDRMLDWFAKFFGRNHCVETVNVGRGDVRSACWIDPLPNVWIGVSCGDQKTANERIPILLKTPAAVRFVSYEPALEAVDFAKFFDEGLECNYCGQWRGTEDEAEPDWNELDPGFLCPKCGEECAHLPLDERLDWLIVGGESGRGARPFDVEWARYTIQACKSAAVACFVKQVGAFTVSGNEKDWIGHQGGICRTGNGGEERWRIRFESRSGADPLEWPDDLHVQEFPEVRT